MPWVTREVPPDSGRWRAVNEPNRPHPRAAPPFDCALCGRHIGKRAPHWVLTDDRVICGRCLEKHNLWNAYKTFGTRAGIAALLGLWPKRRTQ